MKTGIARSRGVKAHELIDVTAGVRNPIDLFTQASNYQLLAKHQRAAANQVRHPVKEKKVRHVEKKEERRMMKENRAARRKIREGKKLRQLAAGIMRNKSGSGMQELRGCLKCQGL